MGLPASTTSFSTAGTAEGGNRLDGKQRKGLQGGLVDSNKEDGDGAAGMEQASPFDRLPDELVSAIFGFAEYTSVALVLVSRRFYRLAAPLRFAEMWFTVSAKEQRNRLRQLAARPHLHPFVRKFEGFVPSSLPPLRADFSTIKLFTNLTYFGAEDISFGSYGDPLPTYFTDTLKSLPHLKTLDLLFETPCSFEDTTFTLGKDLPNLEELRLYGSDEDSPGFAQLLEAPCPNLRHFYLFLSGPDHAAASAVPWASARAIELNLPSPTEDPRCVDILLDALQQSLKQCTAPSHPLRRFKLENDILTAEDDTGDRSFGHTSPKIPLFFDLFRLAQVQEVDLVLRDQVFVPEGLGVVSSVKRLYLRALGVDMCSESTFSSLLALVRLFPSTTSLSLSHASFGAKAPVEILPPSLDFFLARPPLLTFLLFLRHTHILHFEWRDGPQWIEYVWGRTNEEEELEFVDSFGMAASVGMEKAS